MKLIKYILQFFTKVESLAIEEVFVKENILYCQVRDFVSIHPLVIPAHRIFSDKEMFEKFDRQELLKLQVLYLKQQEKYPVKIVEKRLSDNEYLVAREDKLILMKGEEICKEWALLETLSIQEAFKIIYETAEFQTEKKYREIERLKKETKAEPWLKIVE